MSTPIRPITHGYTLTGESNSEFSHLTLSLMVCRYDRQMRDLFDLTWQSNREARHDFYGLRLKISASASEGPLLEACQGVAALLRRLDLDQHGSPAALLARLTHLRIPRLAHESRLHRYVTEAEQLPSDHARWMDDYQVLGPGGCSRAEVAPTMEIARQRMAASWAADVAGRQIGGAAAAKFRLWMEKGCPMRRDYLADSHPATFTPVATLLHTPAEPLLQAAA